MMARGLVSVDEHYALADGIVHAADVGSGGVDSSRCTGSPGLRKRFFSTNRGRLAWVSQPAADGRLNAAPGGAM